MNDEKRHKEVPVTAGVMTPPVWPELGQISILHESVPCANFSKPKRYVIPPLDEKVEAMKGEILLDVLAGKVPKEVKSFSELHNFVDANEYGGFCEDGMQSAMIEHFGGRDENEGMPDDMMHYLNSAQNMIHQWIAGGGIVSQLPLFKVRIENGEFWTDEEDGVRTDVEFHSIKDAVSDSVTFLKDSTEAGLDYTARDIEIVALNGNDIVKVYALDSLPEILDRGDAAEFGLISVEDRNFIEDALAQATQGMRP